MHVEATQDSVACSVLHAPPHEPQLLAFVFRSTHAAPAPLPQSVGSAAFGHDCPQLVPSHVEMPPVGTGHTVHEVVPHELVDVFSKHLAALPAPQLCVPAGQTQSPPWHTVPPAQTLPQLPQLFSSTERS